MEGVLGLHHAACMKLRHVFTYKALRNQHLNGHFSTKIEEKDIFLSSLPEIVRFRQKAAYGGTRISMWQDIFHRHRCDLTNSEWLYPFYRTNLS